MGEIEDKASRRREMPRREMPRREMPRREMGERGMGEKGLAGRGIPELDGGGRVPERACGRGTSGDLSAPRSQAEIARHQDAQNPPRGDKSPLPLRQDIAFGARQFIRRQTALESGQPIVRHIKLGAPYVNVVVAQLWRGERSTPNSSFSPGLAHRAPRAYRGHRAYSGHRAWLYDPNTKLPSPMSRPSK